MVGASDYFINNLSTSLKSFVIVYKVIIIPLSVVMIISLCSMLQQKFPQLFVLINETKSKIGGTLISILFLLYAVDVIKHFLNSLDNNYSPTELLLDPFFPFHLSIAFCGLAMGMHFLNFLDKRSATKVILELEGTYVSIFCLALASIIPPSKESKYIQLCLLISSFIFGCVTIQAVGLSWGVSFFHEMGIISARLVTRIKHVILSVFRYSQRICNCINQRLTWLFFSVLRCLKMIIDRIRSGDRVSRFLKRFIVYPLLYTVKPFLYLLAVQWCQNIHVLLSFGHYYLVLYTVMAFHHFLDLWKEFVYYSFRTIRMISLDYALPTLRHLASEAIKICRLMWSNLRNFLHASWRLLVLLHHDVLVPFFHFTRTVCESIYDICSLVCQMLWTYSKLSYNFLCNEALIALLTFRRFGLWCIYSCVIPMLTAMCNGIKSVVKNLVYCSRKFMNFLFRVCKFVINNVIVRPSLWIYSGAVTLFHSFENLCVWLVNSCIMPCVEVMHAGIVQTKNFVLRFAQQALRFGRRVCSFAFHEIVIPAAFYVLHRICDFRRVFYTHIVLNLVHVTVNCINLLKTYALAVSLICFGVKFWWNVAEHVASPCSSLSCIEAIGLFLGGYVCVLVGLLLFVSKCAEFPMQRHVESHIVRCYQLLDFHMIYLVTFLLSLLKRFLLVVLFRSITKILSVIWKFGFDVVDFFSTHLVHLTRFFTLSVYNRILKPTWKGAVRGAYVIWNSPYISFIASSAVLLSTYYCHVNDLNPKLIVQHANDYVCHVRTLLNSSIHVGLQSQLINELFHFVLNIFSSISEIPKARQVSVSVSWLPEVNKSIWNLSNIPSLGWTLYTVHLCGSLASVKLGMDPKMFARSVMKVIYYPLVLSNVLSAMPSVGDSFPFVEFSFGYFYLLYALLSCCILLLEMRRQYSAPNVHLWNNSRSSRRNRTADRLVEHQQRNPSAPLDKGLPYEYLRRQPAPINVFDEKECPICMEELATETSSASHDSGHQKIYLPCGHQYHDECVLEWLREHGHCPSCRDIISPDKDTSNLTHNLIQGVFL